MKDKDKRYLKEAQALVASAKAMITSDLYANIDYITTVLEMAESNLNVFVYRLEQMETRISALGGDTDDDLHG